MNTLLGGIIYFIFGFILSVVIIKYGKLEEKYGKIGNEDLFWLTLVCLIMWPGFIIFLVALKILEIGRKIKEKYFTQKPPTYWC